VCSVDKEHFIRKLVGYQRKCCNPFNIHSNEAKKGLRVISRQQAKQWKATSKLNVNIVPGTKVCPICRVKLTQLLKPDEQNKESSLTGSPSSAGKSESSDIDEKSSQAAQKEDHEDLNKCL